MIIFSQSLFQNLIFKLFLLYLSACLNVWLCLFPFPFLKIRWVVGSILDAELQGGLIRRVRARGIEGKGRSEERKGRSEEG